MWRTTTRNSPSAILSLPQGQPRAGGCGALNGSNPLPLILSLSKDAPPGEWRSTGKARSTSPTGATDQVQKISPQGEFLLKWGEPGNGPGQFNRPAGIAVDGDGDVYVADWHNHRVQVFSPQGEFLAELAGDATMSTWGEQLLAANSIMQEQRRVAKDLGQERRLLLPRGVQTDDQNRVFIMDSGKSRVQIYRKVRQGT